MARRMFFNEPRVRKRVLKCLPTITIRAQQMSGPRRVVYGSWYVATDTGLDVEVKTLGDIDWNGLVAGTERYLLDEHLAQSGFDSTDEWIAAIQRQHEPAAGSLLYIVQVTPKNTLKEMEQHVEHSQGA